MCSKPSSEAYKSCWGGWLDISVWVSGSFQSWRKIMTNLLVFPTKPKTLLSPPKKGAHVQKFERVPCFWRFWSHFSTKSFSSQGLSPQTHNKKNPYNPTNVTPPIVQTTVLPWAQGHQLRSGTGNGTPTFCLVHGHAGWQTWWVRSPCRISWILSFKGLKEPQQKNHKSAGFGLQIVIASLIHLRRSYGIPST